MQNFTVYLGDDEYVYDPDEYDHTMDIGDYFSISPTECCGWLCLSGFSYGSVSPSALEDFKRICKDITVSFTELWSETRDKPEQFTLFAVLTSAQKVPWEPHLKEMGWIELPKFHNPNTGNTCYPFIRPV